ncbi:S1 RNA binding [Gracilaria domingensis]|nr:S1 RNA binding [Gracilaria domingensis]
MQAFCTPVAVPRARAHGKVCDVSRPFLPARCSPTVSLSPPKSGAIASASVTDGRKRRSRRGTNASQNSRRVPTYKKLQRRERRGPSFDRESTQQAEQHAIDGTDAQSETHEKAEITDSRENGRRKWYKRQITLRFSDIFVGEKLQGVVRNTVPHGVYINVGAEKDGLVHLRDMAIDFVHVPSDIVREGDPVTVWVKYVDPARKILGLTMVKPHMGFEARMKVTEVEIGGRYHGVVERITNYGAYVDIGAERHAFLHVNSLWGECQRDTLDYLRLGQKMWVHVAEIDVQKSHVRLWARAAGGRPLTETNEVSHISLRPEFVQVQEREVPMPMRRSWEPESVEVEEEDSKEEMRDDDESGVEGQVEEDFDDDEFLFAEQMSSWTEQNRDGERNKIKGLEEIAHLFTNDTEFVTEEKS